MPTSIIWLKDRWFIVTACIALIGAVFASGVAHSRAMSAIESNTTAIIDNREWFERMITEHARHPHNNAVSRAEYELLREDIRELKADIKTLLSRP